MFARHCCPVSTLSLSAAGLSLCGLLLSAAVDPDFPRGCTSGRGLCYYSLLLPVTLPVYAFCHLWSWVGMELFRHN